MFSFRQTVAGVTVAFTDRHGGVSDGPFHSLNLGSASGDSRNAVEHNFALLATEINVDPHRLVRMNQVHGADVAVITGPVAAGDRPWADAMVTDRPALALTVRVADCVPVLFADPVAGVIGCAHAGRPGVASGVVPATVRELRALGADDLTAWVGPHVCGGCYEVPEQMRDEVAARVPESYATTTWGTPSLDLGAAVRAQLTAAGCRVVDAAACTRESADLYSYRRDGTRSGRLAGVVVRTPSDVDREGRPDRVVR